MLDQVIVELMQMDQIRNFHEAESESTFMKSAQLRSPLKARLTTSLGDALIKLGLKLKESSHTRLTTETAQAPNFMIML